MLTGKCLQSSKSCCKTYMMHVIRGLGRQRQRSARRLKSAQFMQQVPGQPRLQSEQFGSANQMITITKIMLSFLPHTAHIFTYTHSIHTHIHIYTHNLGTHTLRYKDTLTQRYTQHTHSHRHTHIHTHTYTQRQRHNTQTETLTHRDTHRHMHSHTTHIFTHMHEHAHAHTQW